MKITTALLIGLFASQTFAMTAPEALPKLVDLAPPLQTTHLSNHTDLNQIYRAALKNLDTQFKNTNDGTVYVSTGDIHAEWLRDSSVQVRPYLMFAKDNPRVAKLIRGVIIRQARNILIDPYANAFYENYKIHERKYELDSLVNPILLAWTYWKVTGDASIFTDEVWSAFRLALATMEIEQDHDARSKYTHPHLSKNPIKKTGMIWSGFRPSDDRCYYHYLIPANAMAAQGLHALTEIAVVVRRDLGTARAAAKMEKEVREGIKKYGVVRTREGDIIYAFEVDGRGNAIVMDDGNLPSLVSMPYYGFVDVRDPLYQATRTWALTSKNPFYFSGTLISGIGSPHTPRDMVWPLGILNEALTSVTDSQFDSALKNLIASNYGNTGLHESVHMNDASKFTRADFGWPNAMFVEMALNRWNKFPELPVVKKISPQFCGVESAIGRWFITHFTSPELRELFHCEAE